MEWGASFHKVTWPLDPAEKCDMLYLYYQKAYGHQTWQEGNLLWEASNHKVTQPFEHMVTQSHVIN